MGLEDRDYMHEERAKREGKTWTRPGRFTAPKPEQSDPTVRTGNVQRDPRPPKQRTIPSYVHLQAQEILDARNRKSPPPFSLAVLLFVFLSVGVSALYLYF
ncbi:hypothetical protein LF844_07135 [Metapseudomonas lalkuanensis]|uniref:hypothetical protein n=1 Tax=Metapseudomonas lalkuanensis TaxID=2604832 RepID=UPI001CF16837|nr:hypothetical protein [Pseudomonas lalkuanensis]UCO99576.1 hypothetical protein LF844_07135 [Pseudomonas lalkuanensis]